MVDKVKPDELVLEKLTSLEKAVEKSTKQVSLCVDNMCEHIITAIEKNMEGNLARSIALNSGKPNRAKPKGKDKPKSKNALPWESVEAGECSECGTHFKMWTSIEKHHLGSKKVPKGCCPKTRKPATAIML